MVSAVETQEQAKKQQQIPVFPLGVVLLPGMTMPLHIFEERYKTMINECLEREKPFGIVYFDGKQIHKAGCTAHIIRVLKHYEDGRMDILVQGAQRFYMDQIDDSHDYLVSGVFYFDDIEESVSHEDDALFQKTIDLLGQLDQLSGQFQ